MTEQKITPCLWFDFNAEEAVAHYLVDLHEQPRHIDHALWRGWPRSRRAR